MESLLRSGDSVVVVDNLLTGRRTNIERLKSLGTLDFEVADVTLPLPPSIAGTDFDRLYHLASPASPVGYARHPIETLLVNSLGTNQLLDLARQTGSRFLFTSTSEVYGDPLVHPQAETYWGNVNSIGSRACYDEGKRFGEALVMNYVWSHGLDARIVRIFNTYGPRSDPGDGRFVPNFCVQALQGEPLTIYGDGLQTRTLCYVDDLIAGLRSAMECDELAGEVINLGSSDEYEVAAIAREIIRAANSISAISYRDLPTDDPRRRRPDITKAAQLLGWEPTTPLSVGLERTLDYFRVELRLGGVRGGATH